MNEAEKFHNDLISKIQSWESTEDYASSKNNRQKLVRSLDLLSGTNPNVLRDLLGFTEIPDDPKAAMYLIRNLDTKTLRQLEIFAIAGKDKKAVGHHIIAGNTLRDLQHLPPMERYDFYKRLFDYGAKHGMDPANIGTIMASIHKEIAHGGDFRGEKTGVALKLKPGETGKEFFTRFKESILKQSQMFDAAMAHPSTVKLQSAMSGASEGLNVPELDLASLDTPLESKAIATRALQPIAEQVLESVRDPNTTASDTFNLSRTLSSGLTRKLKIVNGVARFDYQSGFVNAGLIDKAGTLIKNNWKGEALGAGLSALSRENRENIASGDYRAVARNVVKDAAIGGVTQAVGKAALSVLPKVVGGAVSTVATPLAVGALGYQALDTIVDMSTGRNIQETGQDAERMKTIRREAGWSEHDLRRNARTGYKPPTPSSQPTPTPKPNTGNCKINSRGRKVCK